VRDPSTFAAMREQWRELAADSLAGVFNSWEWLHTWYELLGRGRAPRIYTARDARGRLNGLLPLAVERRLAVGLPVRRLAFLGETHVGSDYLDVVARRGHEEEVIAAFAARLLEDRGEWDLLDLLDMDEASPALAVFTRVLERAGYVVRVSEASVCPYELFTPGQSFDEFLRGTSRRDNYLRRRKWLEKQPGYRVERVTTPESAGPAYEEFLRLHALRWAASGGSGGITGPEVEAFHREVVPLLAGRDMLRFYTMWVGETAVASVYGIRERDKFIYYQSGYDPAWGSKSVGMVLVGETFKDAVEDGLREYDFLRGSEAYKSDWTARTRYTRTLRAFRPGSRGSLLDRQEGAERSLRRFSKRVLPADVADKLRRRLR
jgi:CelD/BcsL family acetyltransferase involved in cellulose biosynthesis